MFEYARILTGQDRTGQDRTGQDRTGQDRTGQDRTGGSMLNIAIIDDDNLICSQLENYLEALSKKYFVEIKTEVFYSGETFQVYISQGNFFDVIFLDIEMGNISGIDVSKMIRRTLGNETTQIVYISGKTEYAIDVFDYDPLHFLPKPLTDKLVEKAFLKLLHRTNIQVDAFAYKNGANISKVPIKDIIYFESNKRQVVIHFGDKSECFYGSLENIQNQLKGCQFILIHKSFLINPLHVRRFRYDSVEMSNKAELQIAQLKRKEVRRQLLEYERSGGGIP